MDIFKSTNGIECTLDNISITLDPKNAKDELNFTSHAHADHLPSTRSVGTILCTKETAILAEARGNKIENNIQQYTGCSMVHSGHVVGGCGLLVDDVFYTGDICTRSRNGMTGAKIPKCHTLITECTFGAPQFQFPTADSVEQEVNHAISQMYSRGIPVILMGYEFGKAQMLSRTFKDWKPLYYHERVKKINDVCKTLGEQIPDAPSFQDAEKSGTIQKGPWVMISPVLSSSNPLIKRLKSEYGAVTMGFSGWATVPNHPIARMCDKMFVQSDHCDYTELLQLVEDSGAKKVYTVHGYTKEFASTVRNVCGVDAESLE